MLRVTWGPPFPLVSRPQGTGAREPSERTFRRFLGPPARPRNPAARRLARRVSRTPSRGGAESATLPCPAAVFWSAKRLPARSPRDCRLKWLIGREGAFGAEPPGGGLADTIAHAS